MGTAEPPEHWAPPESLDPTPVWKQYLLVGLLVLGFLTLAVAYVAAAVAPDVVTPPALVPGNRLVLASSEYPPGTTKRVEAAGPERTFYLVRFTLDDAIAIRASWTTEIGGGRACFIKLPGEPIGRDGDNLIVSPRPDSSVTFVDSCTLSGFDAHGQVLTGTAGRALDRYLVSRKGDRLIVNLDRAIAGAARK